MLFDMLLVLTPLTADRLEADRKTYIDDMASLGGLSVLTWIFGAISILLFILAIVLVVKAVRNKRAGADNSKMLLSILKAVLTFFIFGTTLSLTGMLLIPTLFIRFSVHDKETKVICATVRSKEERTRRVSSYRRHNATGVSYVIRTEDGKEYNVSSDVYQEVEEGGTYYLGLIGDWQNCFAVYDVDEYEYEYDI